MRLVRSHGAYRDSRNRLPYVCADAGERMGWGRSVEIEIRSTPAPGFVEVSMDLNDGGDTLTTVDDDLEFEDSYRAFRALMKRNDYTIYCKEISNGR